MLGLIRSIWNYRGFIYSSIHNEFSARFIRSKLGGLWIIINPLSQVAIYTVILSTVLTTKIPEIDSRFSYALYLMSGILAWSLFNEVATRCLTIFIDQSSLIKKVNFPKITLPIIVIGSSLLNNILLLLSTAAIFLILGHDIFTKVLWIFPLTLITTCFATGLGLALGVLNVFIRDIGQIFPIILQLVFWFTPIVYPISIIPDAFKGIISINPLYLLIDCYHKVLVYGQAPNLETLIQISIIAITLLAFSLFLFRRASPEMLDIL